MGKACLRPVFIMMSILPKCDDWVAQIINKICSYKTLDVIALNINCEDVGKHTEGERL